MDFLGKGLLENLKVCLQHFAQVRHIHPPRTIGAPVEGDEAVCWIPCRVWIDPQTAVSLMRLRFGLYANQILLRATGQINPANGNRAIAEGYGFGGISVSQDMPAIGVDGRMAGTDCLVQHLSQAASIIIDLDKPHNALFVDVEIHRQSFAVREPSGVMAAFVPFARRDGQMNVARLVVHCINIKDCPLAEWPGKAGREPPQRKHQAGALRIPFAVEAIDFVVDQIVEFAARLGALDTVLDRNQQTVLPRLQIQHIQPVILSEAWIARHQLVGNHHAISELRAAHCRQVGVGDVSAIR